MPSSFFGPFFFWWQGHKGLATGIVRVSDCVRTTRPCTGLTDGPMQSYPNLSPNLDILFGLHDGLNRCVSEPSFLVFPASLFQRTGWFHRKSSDDAILQRMDPTDSGCNHPAIQTGQYRRENRQTGPLRTACFGAAPVALSASSTHS